MQTRAKTPGCSLAAVVLQRVVVAVVPAAAPPAALGLPPLAQRAVILGLVEVLPVPEQVQVDCQTQLVDAARRAVAAAELPPPIPVHAGVAVGVAQGHLVAHFVSSFDEPGGHAGEAALFLCSDRASFITGQILGVNGGFVI